MTDLEDKILKKNIPGKYTWWDKDSDEEGSLHDSDSDHEPDKTTDMQKVQKWEEKEIPKPLQMQMLNNLRTGQRGAKHTGVKGVLEDYKQAKKQKELEYEIECQYKEALLDHIATGATLLPGETSISAASMNAQKAAVVRRDQLDYGNKEKDEVDEDEEFMRSYRDARLSQLRYSTTFPTFGEITEVDPFEFSDAVDNADPRVNIVVHMYEPYVDDCKKINKLLEQLARRMNWCKFLRLHCFKANPNFDPIALPVLMVYKGGELAHNFVKVTDDLPTDFTIDDVQWLLENCGIVNPTSVENKADQVVEENGAETYLKQQQGKRNTTGVTITHVRAGDDDEEDYDSDDADLEAMMNDFGGNSIFKF
ncbi:hypothetical protein TrLO_g14578 [Triparma laevis f. longispina]|uniref:Phosducin domain-containing protein n=1 Tax=Triparma laevis f. longispina TaxID=1714387 RepID=A0A9W7BYS6_9STRA|nr:hypothetical protein TrLO_g14578 [Triparma laevis f. longispina]